MVGDALMRFGPPCSLFGHRCVGNAESTLSKKKKKEEEAYMDPSSIMRAVTLSIVIYVLQELADLYIYH